MIQLPSISEPLMRHMMWLTSSVGRLVLAAVLGGIVGVERTIHRKPAGIRTNMFICVGAAMFTILSDVIPDPSVGDRTRIASNIVQGVGFLGAGAILHEKGSVSGLTTAATIWVVASIGIAAGASHYLLAAFATIIILLSLNLLGWIEAKAGLVVITMSYEIKGSNADQLLDKVKDILDESHHFIHDPQVINTQESSRVVFSLTCTLPEHKKLQAKMKTQPGFESVSTFNAHTEE
jgi:putative Mg2+ transporter-C (MgtC) family protein